jgi:pimeloyl-ACP methyl ester carboxylesterase
MLPELTKKYCVILLDIIGMGGSSRPADYSTDFTPEQSICYFLYYMEVWREKMNLTKFILAGHSFGGYLVGNYAIYYPQHVKKLLMFSPIGVRTPIRTQEVMENGKTWQD